MIKIFSSGIKRIHHLDAFIAQEKDRYCGDDVKAVIGWGHKPTAKKAREYAKAKGLPYIAVEDGFLRSLKLGVEGAQPLSLTVDTQGVYYDATMPSDLENWLNTSDQWMTQTLCQRAQDLIDRMVNEDLSKYNSAPSAPLGWVRKHFNLREDQRCILVIDQTMGDASVELGLANDKSFEWMLKEARDAHPEAAIFVKTHPDVMVGKKTGYFKALPKGVFALSDHWAPISLLKQFDEIYTVSSQMGFEALFLNKTVHVYGCPFYAGWGLTVDHGTIVNRRQKLVTLEAMVSAVYLKLARYVNPVSGQPIEVEEAMDILSEQRRCNEANRGHHVAIGFRRWKKPHVKAFLSGTDSHTHFEWESLRGLAYAKEHQSDVLVWSSKCTEEFLSKAKGLRVYRMEDGFIRSVGLGSDYNVPYSLVVDEAGIYYDPSVPSQLEHILNHFQSRSDRTHLVERAKRLKDFIVNHQLSKYNLEKKSEEKLKLPKNRKIILVPGQVDDDASVKKGGGNIQSNHELLKTVRANNPDAYIIYKPHPDVESGNRVGKIEAEVLNHLVDCVIREMRLVDLLPKIDELHTLTSLSGFEALMRNIKVFTYGRPFYAGWGVTVDQLAFPRRGKMLTIDELVAGTLILYPRYWDWKTKTFCRPEDVCYRLMSKDLEEPSWWVKVCRVIRDMKKHIVVSR